MLKIVIAIATLITLPASAGAEIYKCRLANGRTEIANAPCATGSSTIAVRQDEHVSEAARRAAQLDVERMRAFVEKREAAQRADQAAERAQQRSLSQPSPTTNAAPPPAYGDTDECLHKVGQMVLEASQRTQLEIACRNLVRPPPTYAPVVVPAYPQGQHFQRPQQPLQPIPKDSPADGPKIAAPLLKK